MADTKISALTAAAAAADANELAINEAGTSKKVTVAQIDTFISQTTKTLTNKTIASASNTLTIDADVSTVSNIKNAEIKAAAAIAVNKLAALSASLPVKTDGSGFLTAAALGYTLLVPIVMEVPNDTVAYPDVHSLATSSTKMTGFWLPNSGTSIINWKVVVPNDLHGTPASKIQIYMMPKSTVANSTVNITIARNFVNDGEDMDAALTAESAVDVNLTTSTVENLTIYSYDLSAEPTAGELIIGTLTRTPGAANDDFTDDLLIVAMYLQIEVSPA